MKRIKMAGVWVTGLALAAAYAAHAQNRGPTLTATSGGGAGQGEQLQQLQALQTQVKRLEGLVPDQAAVMTKVGYHFTNLYFAVQQENWPLADFYLGETQNNIDWAVRTKPVRKDAEGRDIDLAAIAQSIKNTQLKDLKQAIATKQKDRCFQLYEQTLESCYGCHKASAKPYLRPQKPTQPEVKIINFDPNATEPK